MDQLDMLYTCTCSESERPCYRCVLNEHFSTCHTKMALIKCLPPSSACSDVTNILITTLLQVTGITFDDIILNAFAVSGIDSNVILNTYILSYKCGAGYGAIRPNLPSYLYIKNLDIASKRILYWSDTQDLRETGCTIRLDKDYVVHIKLMFYDEYVHDDSQLCNLLLKLPRKYHFEVGYVM